MVDILLTIGLGVLGTLMGFGKVAVSKNPLKNQEYLKKYGTVLRVCGIILIVTGCLLALAQAFGG